MTTSTKPPPYLAIVPVEGTDALLAADILTALQRQWSRRGMRGFLPTSVLELSQLADLGPCWVIRNPEASKSEPAPPPTPAPVRPASPAEVARLRQALDGRAGRSAATPPRPAGVRLAYTSGGGL